MDTMSMEYDPLASKSENWNANTDQIDVGVTLFEILVEVRSLKENFEENKKLIESLRDEIKELRTEVGELKSTIVDPIYKQLPDMPFDSLTDLKEFDERIPLDHDLRAELKIFLQRIGGHDYSSFMRAALRAIVTDELAINLTWRGTPEKPSIQSFFIFVTLRDICQIKFETATHVEINRVSQQHFLHAKDRVIKKKTSTAMTARPSVIPIVRPIVKPTVAPAVKSPETPIKRPTVKPLVRSISPVSSIMCITPPPLPPSSPSSSLLPTLPFTNMPDLEEFDDKLQDDIKLKKALKKFINKLSGRDCPTFVRAAYRAVFTDVLATQMTWRGTKEKPSIQDFTIHSIIRDACRNRYTDIGTSEINKVCQQHFLHAKDRVSKKAKRLVDQ